MTKLFIIVSMVMINLRLPPVYRNVYAYVYEIRKEEQLLIANTASLPELMRSSI